MIKKLMKAEFHPICPIFFHVRAKIGVKKMLLSEKIKQGLALCSLICPFCFSSFNMVEESLKSQVTRASNALAFNFFEQHWDDFSFSMWFDLRK